MCLWGVGEVVKEKRSNPRKVEGGRFRRRRVVSVGVCGWCGMTLLVRIWRCSRDS